jgi:RNA recognition motif-containing protein
LISSLQVLGILESGRAKGAAQSMAKRQRISLRAVPRFRIKLAKDAKQPSTRSTGRVADLDLGMPRAKSSDASESLSIFVGNLPENVTNRDMLAAFEPFGEVENVFVAKNGDLSRGYGFVEFESGDIARKMLRDRPKVMMGPYALVLRPARPRIKRQ